MGRLEGFLVGIAAGTAGGCRGVGARGRCCIGGGGSFGNSVEGASDDCGDGGMTSEPGARRSRFGGHGNN